MPSSRVRPVVRVLLVSLIIACATTGLMPLLSTTRPATAQASFMADAGVTVRKDDDKRRKSKEDKNEEERVLNGQVVDINTLKDPESTTCFPDLPLSFSFAAALHTSTAPKVIVTIPTTILRFFTQRSSAPGLMPIAQ